MSGPAFAIDVTGQNNTNRSNRGSIPANPPGFPNQPGIEPSRASVTPWVGTAAVDRVLQGPSPNDPSHRKTAR